jgi:hypothetical protein
MTATETRRRAALHKAYAKFPACSSEQNLENVGAEVTAPLEVLKKFTEDERKQNEIHSTNISDNRLGTPRGVFN